jgi:DnaJ-class molecular chaperone
VKRDIDHLDGRKVPLNLLDGTIITPEFKKIIPNEGLQQKDGRLGNLIVRFKIVIEPFSDDQLDMWDFFFEAGQ